MTVVETAPPIPSGRKKEVTEGSLLREPLELHGHLNQYKSFLVTPVIGTEFPDANVVDWMKAPNSDELLHDLAVTSMQINLMFFMRILVVTRIPSFSPWCGFFPCADRPHR